ncbi:hypothetical protein [Pseudomonas cucumis]|uniref:hypothetical protein n=1 Tax=Pseudomonas cucumis TaxID=2954082 RepID=UPI0027351B57|nr:hypothetical protein [Pseudomonas cucumis]WLG92717.1 hypothetical protein PSH72_11800 [Pseudomonas cucumis]
MALMRKKLRNYFDEKSPSGAGRQVYQALQSSAQEVAQWCATSCAPFQLILAENSFGDG